MQSIVTSFANSLKSSVYALVGAALMTATFMVMSPRAHALTISVGTQTAVTLPAAPESWVPLTYTDRDGRTSFAVIYTTRSSTAFSVMFASQTGTTASGGGAAPGWTVTTLMSTPTTNSNVGKILNGGLIGDGTVVVYYYDAAMANLRVLYGAASAAPLTAVSIASATVGGIQVGVNNSHVTVVYSSKATNGNYELVLASRTVALANSAITSSVKVTSSVLDNAEAEFDFITQGNGTTRVYYYDSNASALRAVDLDSTNIPLYGTRGTVDLGVIKNIQVIDSGAVLDGRAYVTYDVGGASVKLAAQRRHISDQCWFIQKIDDGSSAQSVFLTGGAPRVSYVKSGNLWEGRASAGTYFDDFSDNIVNAQLGLVNLVSNVTRGRTMVDATGALRDRGLFVPSATNAIGTINWTQIIGNVVAAHVTAPAIPSVDVAAVVSGSATTHGDANLNPADTSNLSKEGGRTNGAGNYQIDVASGSTLSITASSSPWIFVYASSITQTTISTLTATDMRAAGVRAANFIGYSSPTLITFDITNGGGSTQGTSTFSVAYFEGTSDVLSFDAHTRNVILSDNFTRSMSLRLVPQSSQGSLPTVNSSTFSFETGAIAFDHTSVPSADADMTVGTGTFWARFASTDTTNLPKWYTLVATTRTPTGTILQGKLVDAVNLRPVEINVASTVVAAQTNLPGLATSISTAQINVGAHSTFIIRSTFSHMFSSNLSSSNFQLTAVSTAYPPGQKFAADVPLTPNVFSSLNSTVTLVGGVLGLPTGSYFIRYSSRPTGGFTNNPQFAFSPAITISSPAITAITSDNGVDAVITASGTQVLNVFGRGFLSVSTVTFTTHTTLVSGLPVIPAGSASFSVQSSTAMRVTIHNIYPQVRATGSAFHLYITTVHAPAGIHSGVFDENFGALAGSTVVATSEEISATGAVTVGTAAVTAISPSVVTNSRIWSLTLKGRGLQPGSTVQFFSTDGSTWTNVATVDQTGAAAGLSSHTLTVSVDFRNPVMAGKSFYLTVTSATMLQLETTTNTLRIATGSSLLTVSSPSVTNIMHPSLNGNPSSTIYNSTAGVVTIGIKGVGLVGGTTLNFSLMGGLQDLIPVASVSPTSAAFAAFSSTHIHNAAAGDYVVTFSTLINIMGASDIKYPLTMTSTLSITAASISSVTLVSHTSAVSTLQNATYTVVGAGLLPNVTFYLKLDDTSDRIGALRRTTNTADYSSINLGFDLRAATATSTSWKLVGESGGVVMGSTVTLISSGVGSSLSISSIAVLGSIPSNVVYRSSFGQISIPITGTGLVLGATVQALFAGSDLSLGTTQFVSGFTSSNTIQPGLITELNGLGVAPQSSGTLIINLSTALAGVWNLQMVHNIAAGNYSGDAPQHGAGTTAIARNNGTIHQSNAQQFTIVESSAPNAPTGLSVLSAGVKTVTLRWISPGDDGNLNPLTTGSKFIVYIASSDDIRGEGCVPCYSTAVFSNTGVLSVSATNFTFAYTWAQFLRGGERDAAPTVSTGNVNTTAGTNSLYTGASDTRGLRVTTQTVAIADVTVKTSTSATGSTGATSIPPGRIIEATLTIDPGTKDGNFWFTVRAQDESTNLSPTDVVYATAGARILSSPGATLKSGDPTIDPNKDNTVTYTITETQVGGVTVQELTIETPAGALDGADTFATPVVNTSPAGDTGGVEGVGASLDIKTTGGTTEFKKPITLTFVVNETELVNKLAGRSRSLVKMAFNNGSRWVIIQESSLGSGGSVSAQVTHLTEFRVVIAAPPTTLNQATVYPNPYRPTLTAHKNQLITFDQVPANTDVKIYTLAGDLVKILKDTAGTGVITWNAKNEDGQDVASGVYFALLKTSGGGDSKTLKIAVQR